MILFKNKFKWFYLFFVIWALAVLLSRFLAPMPWTIMGTFLFLIFMPGFALSRLLKIKINSDYLNKIILYIALGFGFVFLLGFAALLIGFNINQLLLIYLVSSFALLAIAGYIDLLLHQVQETLTINFREIFQVKNLIYLLPVIFIVCIVLIVNQLGGNFDGDPRYHLAILRKAIEGRSLTPSNLSYFKTYYSIAYIFPVWHIFLAMLAKITNTNIFMVWAQVPTTLSLLVLIIWYGFFKKLLNHNFVALLTFFFFAVFIFRTNGYLLTRMAVPDTLSGLLFLPLVLSLSLEYFFGKEKKLLFLIPILAICMAAVHFTQYFYFIFLIFIFGVIYFVSDYKNTESKPIIRKIFQLVLVNLVILVPFALLLELKNHTLSNTLKSYLEGSGKVDFSFTQFDLLTQISFVLLPFTWFFTRKRKSILLMFSSFTVISLVYGIPFIKYWLIKLLTPILVRRLYDNMDWFFIVIALLIGFIFLAIDRFMLKFSSSTKRIVNVILIVLLLGMIILEAKFNFLSTLYSKIFLSTCGNFLNRNYLFLITASIVTVAAIFYWSRRQNKQLDFLELSEPKNTLTVFLLALVFILLLISPILHQKISKSFFVKIPDPTLEVVKMGALLNQDTADFIKEGIPPKSVIYSDSQYYSIPLLFDQYLPGYYSGSDRAYQLIFRADSAFGYENKLKCLKSGNIEYLFVTSKDPDVVKSYKSFPQYFQLMYQRSNIAIFKINYSQAEADFKLENSDSMVCTKTKK